MDSGHIRVSSEARDPWCVIQVSGELSLLTEREFSTLATEAITASHGPVLFDLSGLDFMDCRGARALVRALDAVRPREAKLLGCSVPSRRVLRALGFDPPYWSSSPSPAVRPSSPVPVRPRPLGVPGTRSRGETLTALTREAESNMRQSARYASEVMSRLATTYSELALNSRYRTQGKSRDRGRLLALSGRALDLARLYLSHADSGAS